MRIGVVPYPHRGGGGTFQYGETFIRTLGRFGKESRSDEFVLFGSDPEYAGSITSTLPEWESRSLAPPVDGWAKRLESLGRVFGAKRHQQAWARLKQVIDSRPAIRQFLRQQHRAWNRLRQVWRRGQPAADSSAPHISPAPDRYAPNRQPALNRWFRRCGIELMLYTDPNPLSFEAGIPYVMAIHDIQHRLQPEFPEVSAEGEWEGREYVFRNGACNHAAVLLLVDSEVGKEDILNIYGPYGVRPDQVKVLPYLPASYLPKEIAEREYRRVRNDYQLPDRYLFYPAAFYPHKNHGRIVQALALAKRQWQLGIPIVFCGPNKVSSVEGGLHDRTMKRTFDETMKQVRELGIEDQVLYLGYVADGDIGALYAGAQALVMPTFFGPTVIPPLEAWAYGCPVVTSDIRGIREQMGDAALLVDIRSVDSIAAGIARVWQDGALRKDLVDRGRKRLANYTPDDFAERLRTILEEAKSRVRHGRKRFFPFP
jgi:glycosyltransferase involved in cell wall biosynthesis